MTTATHLPTATALDPTGTQNAVHDFSGAAISHSESDTDSSSPIIETPRRRSSAFFEEGLKGDDAIVDARLRRFSRPSLRVRFRSKVDVHEPTQTEEPWLEPTPQSEELPPLFPTVPRIMCFILLLAVLIPSLGNSPFLKAGVTPIGAKAVPVTVPIQEQRKSLPTVERRQNSDTDICKRWSGQSAVVNGTMYYYGGRKSTSADQTSDTWSKRFRRQP